MDLEGSTRYLKRLALKATEIISVSVRALLFQTFLPTTEDSKMFQPFCSNIFTWSSVSLLCYLISRKATNRRISAQQIRHRQLALRSTPSFWYATHLLPSTFKYIL